MSQGSAFAFGSGGGKLRTMSALVSVVVIHRNRPDAVGRTVAAFAEQTVPTSVIVVDNGSDQDTVRGLPSLVGDAELISTGANLGKKAIMRLHVRRWHVPAKSLENTLRAARALANAVREVAEVAQACSIS